MSVCKCLRSALYPYLQFVLPKCQQMLLQCEQLTTATFFSREDVTREMWFDQQQLLWGQMPAHTGKSIHQRPAYTAGVDR